MRTQTLLAACALSIFSRTLAAPRPLPQADATSCDSDPLTVDTWKSLDIDTFLKNWSAENVTATSTNNVQSLADSFGAPNFFCGLDNFCNAGQPCLPVTLPAWYAMVAIQNWNSYMNSLNTAVTFASSIISLTLPGIVSDFFPDPDDNVTPLKNMVKAFTTVLGIVPFTGPLSTAVGAVNQGLGFVTTQLTPPAATDRFLAWSNVGSSLASVVQDYQSAISTSLKNTLDAPVDDPAGINAKLVGGSFLGVSQNFTQADLQSDVTASITVFAIGLTLQAQKIFVSRIFNAEFCKEDEATQCLPNDSGTDTQLTLIKSDGDANAEPQSDAAKLLDTKYGISKQQFLADTAACFDANGKKQLTDPFADAIPLNASTQCLFNLIVCDKDPNDGVGIVDSCRNAGNDV